MITAHGSVAQRSIRGRARSASHARLEQASRSRSKSARMSDQRSTTAFRNECVQRAAARRLREVLAPSPRPSRSGPSACWHRDGHEPVLAGTEGLMQTAWGTRPWTLKRASTRRGAHGGSAPEELTRPSRLRDRALLLGPTSRRLDGTGIGRTSYVRRESFKATWLQARRDARSGSSRRVQRRGRDHSNRLLSRYRRRVLPQAAVARFERASVRSDKLGWTTRGTRCRKKLANANGLSPGDLDADRGAPYVVRAERAAGLDATTLDLRLGRRVGIEVGVSVPSSHYDGMATT